MIIRRRKFLHKMFSVIPELPVFGLWRDILKIPEGNTVFIKEDGMMKSILVQKIEKPGVPDLKSVDELFETISDKHWIKMVNWPAFPYKPEVSFKIAYWKDSVLLKYYVEEDYVVGKKVNTNGDVHKDSCVEFFISVSGDHYYNFEFNCIGTSKLGYGKDRNNRILIDPQVQKMIQVKSSLGTKPFEKKNDLHTWNLTIIIPKSSLIFDKNVQLPGLEARGNFYKCGDETKIPHFLTWNPVKTKNPDFHQPCFFGKLKFIK